MATFSFDTLRLACARLCSTLLLCSLPFVLTHVLVQGYIHASIGDYMPRNGDEMAYWHEIATIASVGPKGGHYGLEETVAPSGSLGLPTAGPHSIWFPMVYGLVGAIKGWHPNTPPFINLWVVSLSLLLMSLLMRFDTSFNLRASAFLVSFFYINFWMPVMMMEAFLFGLSFIMAGLFYRVYRQARGTSRSWPFISLAACIFFASLMRYNYAFLFMPFFLLSDDPSSPSQWAAWFGKSLAALTLCAFLYIFFAAPYPYAPYPGAIYGPKLLLMALSGDIAPLVNHVQQNTANLFSSEHFTVFKLLFLEMTASVFVIPGIALVKGLSMAKNDPSRRRALLLAGSLFLIMAPTMASLFLYYYTTLGNIGLRFITSYFIICFFLLLRIYPGRWAYVFIAMHIVLLPLMLRDYQHEMLDAFDGPAREAAAKELNILRSSISYYPAAPSPWCNTLQSVGFFGLDVLPLGVQPGIGINEMRCDPHAPKPFMFGRSPDQPFLARYVLLENECARALFSADQRLEPIAHGSNWTLYLNRASACPTGADAR